MKKVEALSPKKERGNAERLSNQKGEVTRKQPKNRVLLLRKGRKKQGGAGWWTEGTHGERVFRAQEGWEASARRKNKVVATGHGGTRERGRPGLKKPRKTMGKLGASYVTRGTGSKGVEAIDLIRTRNIFVKVKKAGEMRDLMLPGGEDKGSSDSLGLGKEETARIRNRVSKTNLLRGDSVGIN